MRHPLTLLLLPLLWVSSCRGLSPSSLFSAAPVGADPCYDEGRPVRCVPDFVNAAFGAPVRASSTAGEGSSSAAALTDLNNPNNVTCWRSAVLSRSGRVDNVSLTLSLGKKFELTYVSLQFCPHAPKPDSLAIYKSADHGLTWRPFQFYSSNCRRVYGLPNRATITRNHEQEARCSDFLRHDGNSQTGGRIAFSVLEGRPSASNYENSPVLQDWNTATDIRVVFHRMQPPGEQGEQDRPPRRRPKRPKRLVQPESNDLWATGEEEEAEEVATSPATWRSSSSSPGGGPDERAEQYQYSVSDLAVGGRCKCNGHGSQCVPGEDGRLACECRHNTAGRDCERCKPFFLDRPWGRGTPHEPNECRGRWVVHMSSGSGVVREGLLLVSPLLQWGVISGG